MKYFSLKLLLLIVFVSAYSRDNPFNSSVLDKHSNAPSGIYLQEEEIYMPNNSREIVSVTIKYKTLDNTVENKEVELNNLIDWHSPIIIKQNNASKFKANNISAIEYIPFSFIKYKITSKEIYIYTSSNKIRHFHLPKPFKLVIDFDSGVKFRTTSKKINRQMVKTIVTAAHKGFFRTTILLDASYQYVVEKIQSGYKITFK